MTMKPIPGKPGWCRCPICGFIDYSKRLGCEYFHHTCSGTATPEQYQKRLLECSAGTQLRKLIKRLTGENIVVGCGCKSHAAEMNHCGLQWCRDNLSTIIGWLEKEITQRLKKDNKSTWLLRAAGWKLPGQKLFFKRMILLAIKRAERDEKLRNAYHWAYGVTTTPERRDKLLPRTLKSLVKAGFPDPTLFVDKCKKSEIVRYTAWDYSTVFRMAPGVRTYGNWLLALWELYLKQSDAHFFAIFQDDFVTYSNLKPYLERCEYPEKGYWNLYTFPQNQELAKGRKGWYPSNQLGKGAVALVFDKKAVMNLLSTKHLVDRVQNPLRGHKAVDGAISTAMKQIGYKEYVHNPSLVQHTGIQSSMGNTKLQLALSFISEEFDALDLLK